MALHIRDERTIALVRELASRRGIILTEAVRQVAENELARIGSLNDDASSARTPREK